MTEKVTKKKKKRKVSKSLKSTKAVKSAAASKALKSSSGSRKNVIRKKSAAKIAAKKKKAISDQRSATAPPQPATNTNPRVSVPPPIPPRSTRPPQAQSKVPPIPVRTSGAPPPKPPLRSTAAPPPPVPGSVDVPVLIDEKDSEIVTISDDVLTLEIPSSLPPPAIAPSMPSADEAPRVSEPKHESRPKPTPERKPKVKLEVQRKSRPIPKVKLEAESKPILKSKHQPHPDTRPRPVPAAAKRIDIEPAPPSVTAKPSPSIIDDTVDRILAIKAQKGASGPSGNIEERAEAIIATCEAELKFAADKQRIARLHFEIATILELHLNDESKALVHYQKSLEATPQYLPAIRAARRLLLVQKSYPSALKLLDTEIRLESIPKQKAMLHCLKGRILEDLLHQQTKARKCYLQALELAPGIPEVLDAVMQVELKSNNWSALTKLAEEAANAVQKDAVLKANITAERARIFDTRMTAAAEAAETYQSALALNEHAEGVVRPLKRLLYQQSRWRELVDLLEREILNKDNPESKISALLQIGRIHADRLGNRERAVSALERAHQLAPHDAHILEELTRHLALMDVPLKLIDCLQRLASSIESTTEKVGVFHRIGQIYNRDLQDPETAAKWHEQALNSDPAFVPSLRALADLYYQLGRWDDLINMYLAEASATENTLRRADAHVRVAEILEHKMNNPSDAATHHAEALALVPGLESSFKALTRIYTQSKQYISLIKLFETAAEQATDQELSCAYLFKIGAIYEDALQNPELAVEVYRRILRAVPKNLGAIHALEQSAESAGRYREVIEALRRECELTRDAKRLVELHQKIAGVYHEKLEEHEAALAAYKKVLDFDANYAPALAGLGRLYNRLGRWEDLLDIYTRELKLTGRKDDKLTLLMKMAELSETHIGDEERAVKFYRQAISIDATFIPALHALSRNLEQRGDYEMLADILQTELDGLDDPNARARVAYRLGEIQEVNLNNLPKAAQSYRESVAAAPSYRPGLDALTRVAAVLKRYQDLAEHLVQEASISDIGEQDAIEALFQAGIIYSDHLNDIRSAISTFEEILKLSPHHLPTLSALIPLYREKGAFTKLGQAYVRLTNIVQDPKAKVAFYKELARILELTDETTELKQVLMAILGLEADDTISLLGMERVALTTKDWHLLADVDGFLTKLARNDPATAAIYLTRLAQSIETEAPEDAMTAYANAMAFDTNGLTAIRGLAHLASRRKAIDVQIDALQKEASWTENRENAADLLTKAAELTRSISKDIGPSVRDLKEALKRCPEHTQAAEQLYNILTEAGQYELLAEIFTKTAEATSDSAKRGELFSAVARLQTDTLNDVNGAIASLKQMMSIQPNHVPTLVHLAQLYKQNRQWEDAAKTLEKAINQRPKQKVLVTTRLDAANLYLEHLDSPSQALSQIEALLQIDDKNVAALTLLCETQFKKGNLDAANTAAEKLLKIAESPETKSQALLCAAQIRLKKGARKTAAKSFREAIALGGPIDSAWAKDYYSLLGNEESWEDYLDALLKYNKSLKSEPDAREKQVVCAAEISRVQHEGLGNVNDAVATLEQAMQRYGRHPILRYHLAKRLASSSRYKEAIAELNRLIAEDPSQTEMWRLLSHTFRANGLRAEGGCALSPIVVLGEATPEERSLAGQLASQVGLGAPGAFAAHSLWDISSQTAGEEEATQLLAAIDDALIKVFPPELYEYGISLSDRLGEESRHPVRLIATQLAAVFGISEYYLYINPSNTAPPLIELTNPISILVPDSVVALRDAGKVFALSRLFTYAAKGQQAVLKLGSDLKLILAALTYKYNPILSGGHDLDTLDRLAKRIIKATSWRGRRAVEEAAQHLAGVPNLDIAECLQGMERCAVRAAALLSGDLGVAVAEIQKSDPLLAHLSGRELVSQSNLISDLLSFWVSKPAMTLRKKAGLL